MLVYLDNCAFNRPFDDQMNIKIRLEAEAKLYVQKLIKDGKVDLAWSFVLDYENAQNPFDERREQIQQWKKIATTDCDLTDSIEQQAEKLMDLGLRQKDASHIACAIYEKADYFITTDKGILNKNIDNIKIINPVQFTEVYDDKN
jgi:predicted nucleic acid-binding protein